MRYARYLLLIIAVVLLAACDGADPTPTATPQSQTENQPTAEPTVESTEDQHGPHVVA